MYVDECEVPRVQMLPGFWRQTLVSGDDLMLVLFRMRQGAKLTAHRHFHEQLGFVIDGDVELSIAGVRRPTRPGCCYFVDSNRLHHADVLADALVIDAFSPPRSDYLPDAAEAFAAPDGPVEEAGGRSGVMQAAEAAAEVAAPGVERKRLLRGRQVAMSLLTLSDGATLVAAPATVERAGYVVSGAATVTVDGERRRCAEGVSFLARRGGELALSAEGATVVVLADGEGDGDGDGDRRP